MILRCNAIQSLRLAVSLVLAVLSANQLQAQISLQQYREEVVDFSLELKLSDEKLGSAESSLKLARTQLLPSLSMAGSFTQLTSAFVAGAKRWDFYLRPQVSQSIYAGGALRAAVKRADIECDIELCNTMYTLLEVEYAADYAYWNLAAMKQYRKVAERYYSLILSLESVIRLRYDEGYLPKGDLLMIQTRLGEARYGKIASEEAYAVALQNFNILRGYLNVNEEVILSNRESLEQVPSRQVLSDVLDYRPDYQASLLSESYAREGVKVVKASYNPSLSVGVRGLWQPYVPNITGETFRAGQFFVDLSIPIFSFGARYKAVDSARRTLAQSELTTDILNLEIARAEANAWTTLSNQYAQMNYASESLSLASENLEISTYSYEEGLVTIVEVLSAQVSWLQLYTNSIASELAYAVAVADYKRVTANSMR